MNKLKQTNKGQAAMEFLMTYGWAILVVLIVIGAMNYFGLLKLDRFIPSNVCIDSGYAYTDTFYNKTGQYSNCCKDIIVIENDKYVEHSICIAQELL